MFFQQLKSTHSFDIEEADGSTSSNGTLSPLQSSNDIANYNH